MKKLLITAVIGMFMFSCNEDDVNPSIDDNVDPGYENPAIVDPGFGNPGVDPGFDYPGTDPDYDNPNGSGN